MGACLLVSSSAFAYELDLTPATPSTAVGKSQIGMANYFEEETAEATSDEVAQPDSNCADEPACDCEDAACGDEADDAACGEEAEEDECGSTCAENGDLCSGWSLCNCCPGDPWLLQSYLQPCCDKSIVYAGWMQMGYHSDFTGLSVAEGDLLDTNDVPDDVHLQQLWWYCEKATEADDCSWDCGYRFDLVYGTDAQKTQAFGNPPGGANADGWDNDWDHGIYGWAAPQAYLEFAKGDWKIKAGHFYTPLGYEVFPATGNFFYSHSFTFFNSEPFTHTGALGTYSGWENYTVYTGWALGWDTGFDQFGDGNIFLGGFTRTMHDGDLSFTYLCTVGDFGFRSADEFGYSHSIVGIATLTENTQYVIQSDLVAEDGLFTNDDVDNFDAGIVNYLFYTLNDCYKLGGRFEWWQSDQIADNSAGYFEVTGGVNYRPHANCVIRPEMRYQFNTDDDVVGDFERDIFGIDAIFTF